MTNREAHEEEVNDDGDNDDDGKEQPETTERNKIKKEEGDEVDTSIVCSTCQTLVLKKCSCRAAQYCNKTCQQKHRKQHTKEYRNWTAERKSKKDQKMRMKKMTTTQKEEEEGERKKMKQRQHNNNQERKRWKRKVMNEFTRWQCCGNGLHNHCHADLYNMKMGGYCPLCRAKSPRIEEEIVKQLRPWVKKKKV